MTAGACLQFHVTGDTLEVLDGPSEVDASHGLDENHQPVALSDCRQRDGFLVLDSVNLADELVVDEHLGIVVSIEAEHTLCGNLGQSHGIEHRTPAHVGIFEGQVVHVLRRLQPPAAIDQRCKLRQLELGHGDDRHRSLGHGRQGHFLPLPFWGGVRGEAVFLHHRAQFPELRCGMTVLVDRRIVVIRGHIGSKAGRVGTSPVAERGATVGHIEREADALREHLVHTFNHILGRAGLMAGTPFVEPTAPELGAHLGRIGSQFAQAAELLVDVGTGAEVHGPCQVVESVLLEVARPVALEQSQFLTIDAAQTIANL